jgi:hypothetical protein
LREIADNLEVHWATILPWVDLLGRQQGTVDATWNQRGSSDRDRRCADYGTAGSCMPALPTHTWIPLAASWRMNIRADVLPT